MQFQIGIIADWLGLPLDKALAKCAALGADGVQLYAVGGEMAPENMTPASLQEKRALLKDNGLTVSALCGDLGGHGQRHLSGDAGGLQRAGGVRP